MIERKDSLDGRDPRWRELRALWPGVSRWIQVAAEVLSDLSRDTDTDLATLETSAGALDECQSDPALRSEVEELLQSEEIHGRQRACRGRSKYRGDADVYVVERRRLSCIYDQFLACQHLFSGKQWEVIHLYYHDGRTETEIAAHLGKSRTSISGRRTRAKACLAGYQRNQRAEYAKEMRKFANFHE